jgi:hypothetical protein
MDPFPSEFIQLLCTTDRKGFSADSVCESWPVLIQTGVAAAAFSVRYGFADRVLHSRRNP